MEWHIDKCLACGKETEPYQGATFHAPHWEAPSEAEIEAATDAKGNCSVPWHFVCPHCGARNTTCDTRITP